MSQDDPFGINSDRTVIRPNPAGRRGPNLPQPEAAASRSVAPTAPPGEIVPLSAMSAINPLVGFAMPLLALSQRLRNTPTQSNVAGMRERVVAELHHFEKEAEAAQTPRDVVKAAHYALCVTMDDVVNSTPWGVEAEWARASMAGTFHNDTTGGERFFDFLRYFEREPGRFGDVLELMYLCLSLAFEGRMRISAAGASELTRTREGLYALLRQRRGDFERDLSPHWRGLQAPHRPLGASIPLWVVGTVTAGLLVAMFFVFLYLLGLSSDVAYADLGALPPNGKVAIHVDAPPPPPPPLQDNTLARARAFLAPEIREGLVSLSENAQMALIRIHAGGMFASGSAAIGPRLAAILDRIGQELNLQPGAVQIVGHTDNAPIHTLRFPSNYELSLARAQSVRDYLAKTLKQPNRMSVDGRADTEPIADNKTPQGRAENRRIDIVLVKQGASG
jgi:type VI secretion system protein ImpK